MNISDLQFEGAMFTTAGPNSSVCIIYTHDEVNGILRGVNMSHPGGHVFEISSAEYMGKIDNKTYTVIGNLFTDMNDICMKIKEDGHG